MAESVERLTEALKERDQEIAGLCRTIRELKVQIETLHSMRGADFARSPKIRPPRNRVSGEYY